MSCFLLLQTVYVRWEPPSKDGQNGVITGYKVRYRKKDMRGKGDTLTAAGNQRLFAIQNLDKSSVSINIYHFCGLTYHESNFECII